MPAFYNAVDRDGQYTSKKVYYIQYTDTHRFLLKIYNIHILWEFLEMYFYIIQESKFGIIHHTHNTGMTLEKKKNAKHLYHFLQF